MELLLSLITDSIELLHIIVDFIVATVGQWGYLGIFIMMFIESSFFIPFPSEIVMIPAGYLIFQGQMSFLPVFLCGTLGSLCGALCNYFVCFFFGRALVEKYLKISPQKLEKFEAFFKNHGEISTFTSRLIPVIRQYISLPAGFAKMDIKKFTLYTTLGAGLWMLILIALGYFLGQNQDLIKKYLHLITVALLIFLTLITIIYIYFHKKQKLAKGVSNE